MLKLLEFLFMKPAGHIVSVGLGVVALVSSFFIHNANQQAIGAKNAVARTERANADATRKAAAAAAKSVDPAAGGVRNPHYRAD